MALPDCVRPDSAANGRVLDALAVYMAAASFYFVVVFLLDVRNRYVGGNPWYLNKYILLNTISLTALHIAIQYSTDLTTPMMKPWEQLSKLTSSILVCTVMVNVMPSLGVTSSIISDVGALVIVVVPLIVGLGIQIRTRIIFLFLREQIVVMVIMFLQLLFLVSSAVVVPTIKELIEQQNWSKKWNPMLQLPLVMQVDEIVRKYWFKVHISKPQYVVARSPTCIASSSLCVVNITVMIVTMVRVISSVVGGNICKINYDEESGYRSLVVLVVLAIQISAIISGTIGPTSRCMWWSEVVFKDFKLLVNDGWFKVEDYWVNSLVKWKDASERKMNFISYLFMSCVLTLLVKLQMVVVTFSKFISVVSVVPMVLLHRILQLQMILQWKQNMTMDKHRDSIDSNYVSLDVEERSQMEEENALLVRLMKKHSTLTEGFRCGKNFISDMQSHRQYRRKNDNWFVGGRTDYSWALLLVTLSCIIETLPGIDREQVELLLKGVKRGLKHVRLIEKTFDDGKLTNMREAAELFVGADEKFFVHGKYVLGTFINNSQNISARKIFEELSRVTNREFYSAYRLFTLFDWTPELLGADCIDMVCSTIVYIKYDRYEPITDMLLFEWLRTTTLDILGACLTNILDVIHMKCYEKPIEGSMEGVQINAANLLGETKEILALLYDDSAIFSKFPARKNYIEDWQSRVPVKREQLDPEPTMKQLLALTEGKKWE